MQHHATHSTHDPAARRGPGPARLLSLVILLSLLIPLAAQANLLRSAMAAQPEPQQASSAQSIVTSGVEGYTLGSNKLYWYQHGGCIQQAPGLAAMEAQPQQLPPAREAAAIARVPLLGGEKRELLREHQIGSDDCNTTRMRSNVVEYGSNLYWLDQRGFVRLATDANVGEPPATVSFSVSNYVGAPRKGELVAHGDSIYILVHSVSGNTTIWRYRVAANTFSAAYGGPSAHSMRIGADGTVYFLRGNDLHRAGGALPPGQVLGNIDAYLPAGNQIYFARGDVLRRYTINTGTLSQPIYTAESGALIYDLALSEARLFLLERRSYSPCPPGQNDPCFQQANQVLVRVLLSNGQATEMYSRVTEPTVTDVDALGAAGQAIYWQDGAGIKRIQRDADGLVRPDIKVQAIEVTQGIQTLDNQMELIGDRKTIARVYVTADRTTEGVTTYLYRVNPANGQVIGDPLLPANYPSMYLTVRPGYAFLLRRDPARSFQFELPWEWVKSGQQLVLRAVANPFNVPIEDQAKRADNTMTTRVFGVLASPRLEVALYSLSYDIDNVSYYNKPIADIDTTISYIRRTYPLSSKSNDLSAGFRPSLRGVYLGGLGERVTQTAAECLLMTPENRSKCAGQYIHARFDAWRDQNDEDDLFYYGMIPLNPIAFPRGFARGNQSVGPAGPPAMTGWSWDTDATIGDWYAAHEIAHNLGRNHPFAGSDDDSGACGQGSADGDYDYGYPYADSFIGPPASVGTTWAGFDVGDKSLALPMRYYGPDVWHDFMSYCDFQWISDHTYRNMYIHLMLFGREAQPAQAASGDFLHVVGSLDEQEGRAYLSYTRRVSALKQRPALVAGPYSIRLLGESGQQLADYPFTPEGDGHEGELSGISQAVDFVAGARTLQIVRLGDGAILAEKAISAGAPQLSNVQVSGAAPLTGSVTLTWQASDPDGNALSFDVLYSRDGGQEFQPLLFDTATPSATIDANTLAGAMGAIFRVVASDGVQSGQADSAPLAVADKAPEVSILSPGAGSSFQFGQLINFDGAAEDLTDGSIPDARLVWTNAKGQTLAVGARFSSDALPAGSNVITLTATNSAGLKASASVTVTVSDDFALPAPQLSVAPAQLGWHVAPGTTAAQTATLELTNLVSDTLSWTASASAGWVQLSASSGSTPTELTISASPAGLAEGGRRQATVTISATDAQGQVVTTVQVPVTLAIGNTWEGAGNSAPDEPPDTPGGLSVRLPIVLR
jgi:hypothetical protein